HQRRSPDDGVRRDRQCPHVQLSRRRCRLCSENARTLYREYRYGADAGHKRVQLTALLRSFIEPVDGIDAARSGARNVGPRRYRDESPAAGVPAGRALTPYARHFSSPGAGAIRGCPSLFFLRSRANELWLWAISALRSLRLNWRASCETALAALVDYPSVRFCSSLDTGSSIVSESSSHSARLVEICQALSAPRSIAATCVRKEFYLGQDLPNLKEIHPMSTASVTTPVGSVGRQVTDIRVRNWLLAALTVSSGRGGRDQFPCLGKDLHGVHDRERRLSGDGTGGPPRRATDRIGPGGDGRFRGRRLRRHEDY